MVNAKNTPDEEPEEDAEHGPDEKKGEKKEEKSSSSGRWWEFYFVRYALGTVFGVLIIDFLAAHGLGIPFPSGDIKEITKAEAAPLLIIYGLAFCYLASSPMLLFHATRFNINKAGIRASTIGILLGSSAPPIAWELFAPDRVPIGLRVAVFVTMFLIICVLSFQVAAMRVGEYKTDEMWSFYKRLDMNRRVKANKELIDSYRHLREHGNAFSVVLFELLLGFGLYLSNKITLVPPGLAAPCVSEGAQCDPTSSPAMAQSFLLVLFWILPGAYVWCIGCYLEHEFAEDTEIGQNGPKAVVPTGAPASSPIAGPTPPLPSSSPPPAPPSP